MKRRVFFGELPSLRYFDREEIINSTVPEIHHGFDCTGTVPKCLPSYSSIQTAPSIRQEINKVRLRSERAVDRSLSYLDTERERYRKVGMFEGVTHTPSYNLLSCPAILPLLHPRPRSFRTFSPLCRNLFIVSISSRVLPITPILWIHTSLSFLPLSPPQCSITSVRLQSSFSPS